MNKVVGTVMTRTIWPAQNYCLHHRYQWLELVSRGQNRVWPRETRLELGAVDEILPEVSWLLF